MASVAEKLYPPIIGGSIPAFYSENGTAIIAVPFSMNRAVSEDQIGGFRLKIKTVQSNSFIKELTSYEVSNSISNRIVKFVWSGFDDETAPNDTNKIRIGQYLKIQLAYIAPSVTATNDQGATVTVDGPVGYFSTVGVIKYTSKPNVYIEGLGRDTNTIEAFRNNYIGVYETTTDKSERPYSYKFTLYDKYGELVETSGWQLHNTSINNISSESLSLNIASDAYNFQTSVTNNEEYYLQYGVRTINDLEVYSPIYTCIEPHVAPSSFVVNLNATNVFEEAYVRLSLSLQDDYYTDATDAELLQKFGGDHLTTDPAPSFNKHIYNSNNEEIKVVYYKSNSFSDEPISIEVCRAEKTDNFSSWRVLTKVYFTDYNYAINDWDFFDFFIEQGVIYKYCFRQYNKNGISSDRVYSNEVMADFEDMFLLDDERQLKIRFNPKVASFKMNKLESKVDTIGSRYPFIFRNGVVEYREFPIAGLISYLADNNELFMNHEEDLNIILGSHSARAGQTVASAITGQNLYQKITPVNQNENDVDAGKSWEIAQTLDSVGYNMRAERRFKMKLLEWLNNGKIKLFKSGAEGNYLVRLMNISLTPEDKLGRMLHSFSATAYEVEELTYENLVSLGFFNLANKFRSTIRTCSVRFQDLVASISNAAVSVKINDNDILNFMRIETSPNVALGPGFFVRLGKDDTDHRVYVQPGFILKSDNSQLPDVYFNLNDNLGLIAELLNKSPENVTVEDGASLVADAILTYQYNFTEAAIGVLHNINNVYIRNEIRTLVGDDMITFQIDSGSNIPAHEEVLKFFVLNFQKKNIVDVENRGGVYYRRGTNVAITSYDPLSIYRVYSGNNLLATQIYKNDTLSAITDISYHIELVDENNFIYQFDEIPILNLNEHMYRSISIGNGVYLECAYQVKITEFENNT